MMKNMCCQPNTDYSGDFDPEDYFWFQREYLDNEYEYRNARFLLSLLKKYMNLRHDNKCYVLNQDGYNVKWVLDKTEAGYQNTAFTGRWIVQNTGVELDFNANIAPIEWDRTSYRTDALDTDFFSTEGAFAVADENTIVFWPEGFNAGMRGEFEGNLYVTYYDAESYFFMYEERDDNTLHLVAKTESIPYEYREIFLHHR